MSEPFEAIVLAAGFGRRISELTDRRPKPLLPVGHQTPFSLAVEALRRAGATRVAANAAYLAEQVVAAASSLDVEVVVESDGPTGTAGGVAAVKPLLQAAAIVVWNGDVVADAAPSALVEALRLAPIALSVHGRGGAGEGNVGIDEHGMVVRLRRLLMSPSASERWSAWYDGVHAMRRDVLDRVPRRGCLLEDLWWPWLRAGGAITTVESTGAWYDVGDLRSYFRVNVERFGATGETASGVLVRSSVLGLDARIGGHGALDRVVVWPRATATAPLHGVVVRDDGRIVDVPGSRAEGQ